MKKNVFNVFFAGMISVALACGIAMIGCDAGDDDPPGAPTKYTVTFNANGGSVSPSSVTVEAGKTVSSLPTPTKTDGATVFWGWYATNGTTNNDWGSSFTTATVVTADREVFARWGDTAPTKYTVTFNADGGSVTPSSIQVVSGDTAGTLPIPTKTGYAFDGWFTAQHGGGTPFTAATPVTAALTVYAKWTAGTDTVPAPGRGTVTLIYPEDAAVDAFSDAIILSKNGADGKPTQHALTVNGEYGSYRWRVDGTIKANSESIVLNAADYGAGIRQISVEVTRNGVIYAKSGSFTVEQ
ncbi:MAG: InlB B-repeat-containing protein [Treponema sp.]|nr:InlB B-repeat-containing protein [Treponema sp.]